MTQEIIQRAGLIYSDRPHFADRAVSLRVHENFYANAVKRGQDWTSIMAAIGYAVAWGALTPALSPDGDQKDQLELLLQFDGELSCWYRTTEGETKFYMAGIPSVGTSSYSFHS